MRAGVIVGDADVPKSNTARHLRPACTAFIRLHHPTFPLQLAVATISRFLNSSLRHPSGMQLRYIYNTPSIRSPRSSIAPKRKCSRGNPRRYSRRTSPYYRAWRCRMSHAPAANKITAIHRVRLHPPPGCMPDRESYRAMRCLKGFVAAAMERPVVWETLL